MNVYEFLSAYLPPPMIGFILGVSVGFGLGLIFSKGFFVYLSESKRLAREDRKNREKQEQENARCLAKEKAFEGLEITENGYYVQAGQKSPDAGPCYCAECLDRKLQRIQMRDSRQLGNMLHCPSSGHLCDKF